jgi:hypothetical protein
MRTTAENPGFGFAPLPLQRGVTPDAFQPNPGLGDLCNGCGFQNFESGKPPCLARFPDLTRKADLREACSSYRPLNRLEQVATGRAEKPPLGFHNVKQVHTFPDSK